MTSMHLFATVLIGDGEEEEDEASLPATGSPSSKAESAERKSEPAARPRILVVEDDYLVGMEIEAGLSEAGYEVIGVAATAEEALSLAESGRPLLAIMDIRLAGARDGVDAALEIHRRLGIRPVFASAHVDAEVRARAEGARPLAWIAKPYRVSTLVQAVRKALAEIEEAPAPSPRPEG
jgi:DNA-binding NarL/FixJ family response regulator